MARAQRDTKITICHFLWMGNHLHLLFLAMDAESCAQFYSELMKKVTDYLKRLLGLSRLELWEPGGPVLSRVLDVDKACDRVAYIYANPSRADLVESISNYPGYSSWEGFNCDTSKNTHIEEIPWVRLPTIRKLFSRTINERQDTFLTEKLSKSARLAHTVTIHPNAFYKVFGIEEATEISRYNERILNEIKAREETHTAQRAAQGKKIFGANALKREPIMKAHKPERKSSDRKILYHTSLKELALSFLNQFDAFCAACRKAYLAWRDGNYSVEWPPGAFRPPVRPCANAIA